MASNLLYSDIFESPEQIQIRELRLELEQEKEKRRALEVELDEARLRLNASDNSLGVVKRNISAIYHTAKKELQRKDALIADLRQQQSNNSQSRSTPAGKDWSENKRSSNNVDDVNRKKLILTGPSSSSFNHQVQHGFKPNMGWTAPQVSGSQS